MQTHKQSPTRESETRSCSICLFSLKNYTCSTDVSDTQMRTGPNVIKPWEVLCLADLLEGCLFYSGLTCLLPPQLSCCVRGVLCVLAVPLQHTMSNTEALINQLSAECPLESGAPSGRGEHLGAEPTPMGFDLDRLSSLSQRTGSGTVQRPESHLQAHPRYRKEVCLLGRKWQLRLFRWFENLVRGIGDGVIRGLHSYKVAQ